MKINGETITLKDSYTVGEFLDRYEYKRDRIAVELNHEVIPKEQYDKKMLVDSDQIEIVQFMGGG